MKNKWKKAAAFAMSLSLVAVNSTVSLSNSNTIVAKASEANSLVNETEETESVNKVASEKEVDESYYDADTKTLHLKGNVRNSEDNTGLVLPEDAYGKDIINIVADKGTVLPVDSSYLFYKSGAETIDLKNADASNVTNMSYMFDSCMNIKSLDMSNLDTSNVTNMASMFSYWWHCADYINLSGLDTSNVTDMSYMFYFNSAEPFDLTVLDTSSVTDMSWMFAWGGGTILNLSSFETSNVIDMSYMFYMTDPETIYVGPDWTAKPAFSESMFEECYNIVGGAGTVYDPEHVDAEYAHIDGGEEYPGYLTFKNPYKNESYYDAETKTLHLKGNIINRADQRGIIYPDGIGDVINIVADEGTVLPVDSSYLFYKSGAETIDLKNADASNVTNMSYMFDSCMNIKSLDMSNLDTSNVTNMASMFSYWWHCADYINLSGLDTSNVTDMSYMFYFNSAEPFDLTVLDTSSVTDMSWMFAWGGGTILNLSSFETSNVIDMSYMFYMTDPETIYVGPDWTAKPAFSESMFEECYNIVGGAGTVYDPEHVDAEYAHIDGGEEYPGYLTFKNPYKNESYYDAETKTLHLKGNIINSAEHTGFICPDGVGEIVNIVADEGTILPADSSYLFRNWGVESIDLKNADASNVTNMSFMFEGCFHIKSLDMSNLDTSNVTNMAGMFSGWWHAADYVDISGIDTSNVTDMSEMFFFNVTTPFDLTVLDTSSVTDMSSMFAWGGSTILDLSSFDTSKVTDMSHMFYMSDPETIYVGPGWTTELAVGDMMFGECYSIVGGAGTVYDPEHIDIEYAHIDGGKENPGYFTAANTNTDDNTIVIVIPEETMNAISYLYNNINNPTLKNIASSAMNFLNKYFSFKIV